MTVDPANILSGCLLGLSAGFSPGSFQTLLIAHTMQHRFSYGVKIAFAPLATDAPIIALSALILSRLSETDSIMGITSLCGAAFITWLGIDSLRYRPAQIDAESVINPRSLVKGVITNFLNPNPYLFWMLIGAPLIQKAAAIHWINAVFFLLTFYCSLIGTFIFTVWLVDKGRNWLTSKAHLWTIRILGMLLIAFALFFIIEAGKYFHLF